MNHQYTIRSITPNDYSILKDWAEKSLGYLPETMVPTTTYIVEESGVPIVSGCLYLMNCPSACMIENILSNPETKGKREGALAFLLHKLEEVAISSGYNLILLFSYESKVKAIYDSLGYTRTLENVTTYAKRLA